MDKKLKITIEVDSKTKELKVLEGDFNKLSNSIQDVGINLKQFGNISDTIVKGLLKYDIAKNAFLKIASAIKETIQAGIKYNASIEQMRIGIASLLSVQQKAIDKNFQFSTALTQSQKVMQMLKKANLETSATLPELTAGFQAALAPALQARMNIKQTVEYTKLMTQAAGAMGVPMHQLAQELKSVVSGTIDLNSVVATNLGITNEQIRLHKKQGDLFEFLKNRLSAFAMAGEEVQNSFSGSISNLEDTWSELTGEITKPIFEHLKEDIKEITKDFKSATSSIHDFMLKFRELKNINEIDDIKKKIKAWKDELEELSERAKKQPFLAATFYAEMNTIQQKILKAQEKLNQLIAKENEAIKINTKLKQENIDIKLYEEFNKTFTTFENGYEKLVAKYEEYLAKYKDIAGSKIVIDKWYEKELEKLNQKEIEEFRKKEEEKLNIQLKTIDERLSAEIAYLEAIGDKESVFWIKEGEKIRKLVEAGLSDKKALKVIEADYKKFLEKNTKITKKTISKNVEYIETVFDKATKNIYKSFEDNFFDAITGKFRSFKDFMKNLFDDVLWGIINPFAKQMSQSLATSTMNLLGLQTPAQTAQLQAFAQTLPTQLIQAGWKTITKDGKTFYVSGSGEKVSVENGQIQAYTDGGELTSLVNLAALPSSIKTGYSLITNPSNFFVATTGAIGGGIYGIGNTLYTSGFTNAGMGFIGAGNWLTGAGTSGLTTAGKLGYYGTGALVGGVGGYLLGSLGDKLFGADTYAPIGGAAGGALGATLASSFSVAGPVGAAIGAVLGSVIGGLFGKKKITSTGIYLSDVVNFDNLGNIYNYQDWEKKGWFHKSSGTKITGIVSDTVKNYLKYLFYSFDTILKDVFKHEIPTALAPGKIWSKDNALERTFAQIFVERVLSQYQGGFTKAQRDAIVKVWEDYAKGINKTVTEAIIETFQKYLKFKQDFSVWLAKFEGDTLKSLELKAKYAQQSIENLKKYLGITEVTLDNYLNLMQSAINNSPTPDTIQAWEQLGNALQQAAEAQKAYTDAIENEIRANIDKYKQALDLIEPKTISNTKELLKAIANATPKTVSFILNAINNLKNQEIKAAQENYNLKIKQLNNEKSVLQNLGRYLDQLRRGADRLRATALRGTIYTRAKYLEFLNRVDYKLGAGKDVSNDIESLVDYASAYQEYLKATSSTEQEYLFEVNKMANTLDDMAGRYDIKTQTDKIENAIIDTGIELNEKLAEVDKTYQQYTNLLKLTIEKQYQDYVTKTLNEYEQYLGSDSPIIQELKAIKKALTKDITKTKSEINTSGVASSTSISSSTSTSSGEITQIAKNNLDIIGGATLADLYARGEISTDKFVKTVFERGLNREPDTEGLNWWTNTLKSGNIDPYKAANAILTEAKKHGETVHPFADGGIVTKPTLGVIGEAGYSEAVIPLKNPNDPLFMNELKEEIKTLRSEVARLRAVNEKYQSEIAKNTRPIKNDSRWTA